MFSGSLQPGFEAIGEDRRAFAAALDSDDQGLIVDGGETDSGKLDSVAQSVGGWRHAGALRGIGAVIPQVHVGANLRVLPAVGAHVDEVQSGLAIGGGQDEQGALVLVVRLKGVAFDGDTRVAEQSGLALQGRCVSGYEGMQFIQGIDAPSAGRSITAGIEDGNGVMV